MKTRAGEESHSSIKLADLYIRSPSNLEHSICEKWSGGMRCGA